MVCDGYALEFLVYPHAEERPVSFAHIMILSPVYSLESPMRYPLSYRAVLIAPNHP